LFFHLVDNHLVDKFLECKVRHFRRNLKGIIQTFGLKKYFQAVDAEDAAVADTAALAGGKDFDIATTSVNLPMTSAFPTS